MEGEPGAYRTVSVPRTGLLACSGLDIATLMERRDALEEFAYCRPMQTMQAWVRDRTTYLVLRSRIRIHSLGEKLPEDVRSYLVPQACF